MNLEPWWISHLGRLEHELSALSEAGIKWAKDKSAFSAGVLQLNILATIGGQSVDLVAVYPDQYPYFRFEVRAPGLDLPHHQNPFQKNVCLIGRSTDLWHTKDTLADFVVNLLPRVLEAGRAAERSEVEGLEVQQAEPITDYYIYQPGTGLIIGGRWTIPEEHKSGEMIIGVRSLRSTLLQGALLEVRGEDRNVLARSESRLRGAFPGGPLSGRWVQLSEPPKSLSPQGLFTHLLDRDPNPHKIESYRVEGGRIQVRGASFPEEVRGWRQVDTGWIFVCRLETHESWKQARAGRSQKKKRKKKKK